MGTNYRHFKALSKKNWINWKRTPLGNIVEFATPFIICMMMWFTSLSMDVKSIGSLDLTGMSHGLYPAFSLGDDGEFEIGFEDLMDQMDTLNEFMVYGGVGKTEGGYVPFIDPLGPMFFFPFHCAKIGPPMNIHASPIIGYIEQDNPV